MKCPQCGEVKAFGIAAFTRDSELFYCGNCDYRGMSSRESIPCSKCRSERTAEPYPHSPGTWACMECGRNWRPNVPSKPVPSVAHFTPTAAMRDLMRAAKATPRVQTNVPLGTLKQIATAEANFREVFRLFCSAPSVPFYQAAMDSAITVLFSSLREGK